MASIGERRKCPKCGSDFLEWEAEIYSPFWVDEFTEECPDCGYFRQVILDPDLSPEELHCMHFSHSSIGTIRSGIIKKPPELQGKFVFMFLHPWSLPDLEIQWYKPEEVSTDFRRVLGSTRMTRKEHEIRHSAEAENRKHAKYCKEVQELTQEDLAEIFRRGVEITNDPDTDLMVYEAKKQELEKAEEEAANEFGLNDQNDIGPAPSESPSILKDLLQKAIDLAWKIAGAK